MHDNPVRMWYSWRPLTDPVHRTPIGRIDMPLKIRVVSFDHSR